jgi:hypothetical protein
MFSLHAIEQDPDYQAFLAAHTTGRCPDYDAWLDLVFGEPPF